MLRRHFLTVVGTFSALSTTDSTHPDDRNDGSGSAPPETDPSHAPLEACFGTADLHFHDETIDVRVTTGEIWTGRTSRSVADLRIGLHSGEVVVTLYEEDVRALVAELSHFEEA